jgi:hypothetical protein
MPDVPATLKDELRDLIAKGWTPPESVLKPYSHLLRAFYDAKGWNALALQKLDDTDRQNLAALIAVFDTFGIDLPPAPEPQHRPGELVIVSR